MYLRLLALVFLISSFVQSQLSDICGTINGKRFYLENGEGGSLQAVYHNNALDIRDVKKISSKCTVEFLTCPSCIIEIKFRYLNISRNCGKSSVFDTCGCDYVWIHEPSIEDASGEQFCGRFVRSNFSEINYISQTQAVAIAFMYNTDEYGHAFTLDYYAKRNRIHLKGYPKTGNMNNGSQFISSPFFPSLYPIDLSVEYVINCDSPDPCRISILFTDFLIADSSILEFFDGNGQRKYVTSGDIFRPPVIVSTGPSMIIRFYANGASSLGFKASYSFILGNLETVSPNIGCGGNVNNLGGGITMMNMVQEGTKFFDCVWIIKPPINHLHRKTHLYVKVIDFLNFAGTTELVIKQGLTSNQPTLDILRYPMNHFSLSKQTEHVPITQGFYIRLRGHFRPESRLAIVFAAFNYKDCFAGSDFLCHNLRCISSLLNCDGFDHCGDNSDESSDCSLDPKDHREYSKIPNFLFPKMDPYTDIATATFVFLTCSFEEGVGDVGVEEEIIVPDEPPDYEAPPDYDDVLNVKYLQSISGIKVTNSKRCPQNTFTKEAESLPELRVPSVNPSESDGDYIYSLASTSTSFQITPVKIPESPPPAYEDIKILLEDNQLDIFEIPSHSSNIENPEPGPSRISMEYAELEAGVDCVNANSPPIASKYFESIPKYPSHIFSEIRKSFRNCGSVNFIRHARNIISFSEENLVRYFSDSELIFYNKVNINCWSKSNMSRFKKSFSTDDISLL